MAIAQFGFKDTEKYLNDGTCDWDTDTVKLALVSNAWHIIPARANSTAYARGSYIKVSMHYYRCQVAGTSDTTPPSFPTDGTTVTDGTVLWQDVGTSLVGGKITIAARVNSASVPIGHMYRPATANGHWYEVTTAGTLAGSEPTFKTDGTSFTDGTATIQDRGCVYPSFVGKDTVWADMSSNEISGTGYTTGGVSLTGKAVTSDFEKNVLDADDVTYSTVTITARWAVMYRSGTVNSLTDPVLFAFLLNDSEIDVSPPAGTDFVIQWATSGIYSVSNIIV